MRPRMRPNSSSESSVRGRQLDVEDALLGGDERVELVGDLGELAGAALLGDAGAGSCTTSSSEPSAMRVEHVRLHARSTSGFSSNARELVVRSRRRRGAAAARACTASSVPSLLRGLEERARIDAVRDGYDRLPSSCEKSISASASSIRRCWSAPVSDLRVIFSAASEAELADLVADLAERLLGRLLDLAAGLLEPALAVLLGLLADALALRVGDAPRLAEDLLGLRLRLADQLPVLLEQAARLGARVVGLVDRALDALAARRRSSAWIGPNAYLLQHEERDQEADDRPDHQPRRDLDQWVRREHRL